MTKQPILDPDERQNVLDALRGAESDASGQAEILAATVEVTSSLLRAAGLLLLNAPEVFAVELDVSKEAAADTAIGVLAGALEEIEDEILLEALSRLSIYAR